MNTVKSVLIFCLTLLVNSATATVFTVTSNADAGPGTLREAILMANANGTAVQDLIQFNLTDLSIPGRTIILRQGLPFLSSNMVIDGSTQAGMPFGVSGARVILTSNPANYVGYGLAISDADHIGIYGIFFKDINPPQSQASVTEISLFKAHDVQIGGPGKGNLFNGFCTAISSEFQYDPITGISEYGIVDNLTIQSNIFGLNEEGTNIATTQSLGVKLYHARNVLFGGDTDQEGNYLSSYIEYPLYFLTDTTLDRGRQVVSHNFFGVSHDGTTTLKFNGVFFETQGTAVDNIDLVFRNNTVNNLNTVTNSNHYPLLSISGKHGYVDIRSNRFNSLISPSPYIQTPTLSCISLTNCNDGRIGGDLPDDTNYISHSLAGPAISLINNAHVRINHNAIYCNDHGISVQTTRVVVPEVKIMQANNTDLVAGTATPNCRIEVYQTPDCFAFDNAQTYMGETRSDATGNWSFTGPYSNGVSAIATTDEGVSGQIAIPRLSTARMTYQKPGCGRNNGYIHGLQVISGSHYYWLYSTAQGTDTIDNRLDLDNIAPGAYELVVEQTKWITIFSDIWNMNMISPQIDLSRVGVIQPSCGHPGGVIGPVSYSGENFSGYWINESRDSISTNPILQGLSPGRYKFLVMNRAGDCGDSTDWFTIRNQDGPSLDVGQVSIQPATCGRADGSIRGLKITNSQGAGYLAWRDSLGHPAGLDTDLLDVHPGAYRLVFKDASACDTLYSIWYRVGNEGSIFPDSTQERIIPSACRQRNGGIKGWMAANVDTWIWTALADGSMVGNAADLAGMPQGRYQLTATNSMGCRYTSRIIEVPASGFRDVSYTAQRSFKATCATNNAFFDVTGFSGDTSGYRFWFTDSVTGSLLAKGTALRDLGAGTFHFRAADPQGCEKIVESFTVIALPKPVIDLSGMVVRPDHCDFAQGGISGIRLNGLAGPTAYAWTDAGGREVGNALNLGPVKAGAYNLNVTDAGTCTLVSGPITIDNQNGLLEAPRLSSTELTIPRNTAAHIEVIRPDTGTYVLAADSAFLDIVDRNLTGSFQTAVLGQETTFFVMRLAGACRTPWVVVHVRVVDETSIYVPNAFTPNGDGLNDRLRVRVYGLADQASFVIYDRWGEKVFATTDLNAGWDGTFKGSPGPVGTYTWYLTARDVRGAPVNRRGTVTLMR